jgi:hypothetical protein
MYTGKVRGIARIKSSPDEKLDIYGASLNVLTEFFAGGSYTVTTGRVDPPDL